MIRRVKDKIEAAMIVGTMDGQRHVNNTGKITTRNKSLTLQNAVQLECDGVLTEEAQMDNCGDIKIMTTLKRDICDRPVLVTTSTFR